MPTNKAYYTTCIHFLTYLLPFLPKLEQSAKYARMSRLLTMLC